jgi:hypothetical protein
LVKEGFVNLDLVNIHGVSVMKSDLGLMNKGWHKARLKENHHFQVDATFLPVKDLIFHPGALILQKINPAIVHHGLLRKRVCKTQLTMP